MNLKRKLEILSDAAKYDASCSSSGSNRPSSEGTLGSTSASGLCHSFTPDGRCISLFKILLSNYCTYDCHYCINRQSNDIPRATFTDDEVIGLTMNFYRRNYIEGLFLSSGIIKNPNYTMERLTRILKRLRVEEGFRGYIHVKAIPGADDALIKACGLYADRMSVNIELPSSNALKRLAPDKASKDIFKPMSLIQSGMLESQEASRYFKHASLFVPAGQSTQLIVGASPETDFKILSLSESLYQKYSLKRVYYSAYVPINTSHHLPSLTTPPVLREHRLYQGDWLLRLYGFKSDELLSAHRPHFDLNYDPKTAWALDHLSQFPLEINRASYDELIRVPGIGIRGAKKIISARRLQKLTFSDLRKLRIVLKRAQYFILCDGKYNGQVPYDDRLIRAALLPQTPIRDYSSSTQLSLFDTPLVPKPPLLLDDFPSALSGEL